MIFYQRTVVAYPVRYRAGPDIVAEHAGPAAGPDVGDNDCRALLVSCGYELEHQASPLLVDVEVAQLVYDQ